MQRGDKMSLTKRKKIKRYDINPLVQVCADYNTIIGARTNGKSYQVKLHLLKECWNNDKKLVYLRRWKEEVKIEQVEKYWSDMVKDDEGNERVKEVTEGKCDCITVWRGSIYLGKTNEETNKIERVYELGYTMRLAEAETYKSGSYPNYDYLLWEEFITNKGYTPREMEKFMSIISTVFRARKGKVFMIANTIATVCPAFIEWGIDYRKLQKGTISVFNHTTLQLGDAPVNVKIAVEYTDVAVEQAMIFGKSKQMMVSGEWETRDYPKIPEHLKYYKKWYTMYVLYNDFRFVVTLLSDYNKYSFVYIYPYTHEELPVNARIVTDVIKFDRQVTSNMSIYRNKYDKLIMQLLTEKRVCFSDNLTATGFYQTLVALGHTKFREEYKT